MRTKQKILQLSKGRLKVVAFTIFFNVLLAGSVCGTFAWYTYATRTGFDKEYHGITVGDSGEMEVGLVSTVELEEYDSFDLAEDKVTLANEEKIIYWCDNEIDSTVLRYVVGSNGYSTNTVNPVTTGSNDILEEDNFHLYRSQSALRDYPLDDSGYAEHDSYVHVSFVFRYKDPELDDPYAPNREVYFTECKVHTSEDSQGKEVYKAVRVCAFNGSNGFNGIKC